MKIVDAVAAIEAEYRRSMSLFPNFNSPHEGYAVLLEEVDELWESIKNRKPGRKDLERASLLSDMQEEAVQIGAMAVKFLVSMEAWR